MKEYEITWQYITGGGVPLRVRRLVVEGDTPEQAVWNLAVKEWIRAGQIHRSRIISVKEVDYPIGCWQDRA